MTTITSLCTASSAEDRARAPTLPPAPLQTRPALGAWRTAAYGSRLSPCPSGGQPHRLAPACGQRHGPQGPPPQARQWRHPQRHPQRPGPYCRRTCPSPAPLRPCCRAPPRLASQALCQVSSAARTRRARAARGIGTALPGLPGILPPWGRQLPSPPPRHSMVPGGGLAPERAAWWPARAHGSVPGQALAPLSRALCHAARPPAGLVAPIAPQGWPPPGTGPARATLTAPRPGSPSLLRSAQWPSPATVWSRSRPRASRARPANPPAPARAPPHATSWRVGVGSCNTACPRALCKDDMVV